MDSANLGSATGQDFLSMYTTFDLDIDGGGSLASGGSGLELVRFEVPVWQPSPLIIRRRRSLKN